MHIHEYMLPAINDLLCPSAQALGPSSPPPGCVGTPKGSRWVTNIKPSQEATKKSINITEDV